MHVTQSLCPRCRVALYLGDAPASGALACAQCGGVWLDRASSERVRHGLDERLNAVANRAPQVAPAAQAPAKLACPICSRALAVTHVGNIELDVCPEHGTWFDHLELQGVARAFAVQRAYGVGAAATATAPAPTPNNNSVKNDVADTAADIGVEVAAEVVDVGTMIDGAGVVVDVAGSVLDGAFSLVGGVFDGLT